MNYIKIDKYSSIPLYEQIRQCITDAIRQGQLKPGQKLPTEEDICKAWGISRPVVRQAYNDLVNKGVIERKRGSGSFVKDPDNRGLFMNQLLSFEDEMRFIGKTPSTQVLCMEKLPYTQEIYEKLELTPANICLKLERVRYSDNTPFVHMVNYLPLSSYPKLDTFDYSKNSLYKILDTQYGVHPVHSKRCIMARNASDYLSAQLKIPTQAAVLVIENIVYDQYDRPLEISVESISGESHEFHFDVYRSL